MGNNLLEESWFIGVGLQAAAKRISGNLEGLSDLEIKFAANFFLHYLMGGKGNGAKIYDLLDFLSFSMLKRDYSNSQILQDLWVLYKTREKRGGYFVEFGACDGVLLSNTLVLERDYGWEGVLAEPSPVWHESLYSNRNCYISTKCVHELSGIKVPFSCATVPELSRIESVVPSDVHETKGTRVVKFVEYVETVSLFDLLVEAEAPRYIDYLSIDTEGSEGLILRDFDFSAFQFGLITVEHAGEAKKRESIYNLLSANGYERWFPEVSRWDDWYVRVS